MVLPLFYSFNIPTFQQTIKPLRSYYDSKSKTSHNLVVRNFRTSSHLFAEPNRPSSKIEETTEAIKEKLRKVTQKKTDIPLVVRPLSERILFVLEQSYNGFKLLFIDIRVSSILMWKVLKGGTLTRREYNLFKSTVGDIVRLVPYGIVFFIPFMEIIIPIIGRFFPGILPQRPLAFQSATEKEAYTRDMLKVKLDMAKFLQQTLNEMAATSKGHSSSAVKEFVEFFHKVRTEGGGVTNEEILKFSKLFRETVTIDVFGRPELMALCRILELQAFGTTNFLRFQLRLRLRSLVADDIMIKKEGVESLTLSELQQACGARGIQTRGISKELLRAQLNQWIDLSLNEKVPPALLLLSRASMLRETTTTTKNLVDTISALPDTVVTKTKAHILELEGHIDNKAQIDFIKEEEAKIEEEKKELEEEIKVAEKVEEVLVDKAPKLVDKATLLVDKPKEEKRNLSAKDIGETLEDVLEVVAQDRKKLIIEKEELNHLKKDMVDYIEDVQNLEVVSEWAIKSNEKFPIRQSKAAKSLSKTLNRMISEMDETLAELEKKEEAKKETLQKKVKGSSDLSDELLKLDELIQAIKKIKRVSDAGKETIIEVLREINYKKDGVIKADDLRKVVEVIGRENIKLNQKQIKEVIELIKKEEMIEKKEGNKNGESKLK